MTTAARRCAAYSHVRCGSRTPTATADGPRVSSELVAGGSLARRMPVISPSAERAWWHQISRAHDVVVARTRTRTHHLAVRGWMPVAGRPVEPWHCVGMSQVARARWHGLLCLQRQSGLCVGYWVALARILTSLISTAALHAMSYLLNFMPSDRKGWCLSIICSQTMFCFLFSKLPSQ
jgi:hypothetical protein